MSKRPFPRRTFLKGTLAAGFLPGLAGSSEAKVAEKSRFHIETIDLFTRVSPPGRMAFAIGKQDGKPAKPLSNPVGYVRMGLRDAEGNRAFGCSGERLSVRWLDKRPGRPRHQKLVELVGLIEQARRIYLEGPNFDQPFDQWLSCYKRILHAGREAGQVDLTSAFASSLMERAMLDGVCRLAGRPLFDMVREDRLGFRPAAVHPELEGLPPEAYLRSQPVTNFHIRHTIGITDPLTDADLLPEKRLNDGLPETLEEYVETDGLTYFKVKIEGETQHDLDRLARVWEVLPKYCDVLVTMDANEMFPDLSVFEGFLRQVRRQLPGLFDHIAWVEQPVPRALSLDPASAVDVRRISRLKPLIIDEADGTLDAFKRARQIGYSGTSHKDCKGFFKSLLNRALIARYREKGHDVFMSGEDLTCLPIVPLHQDFVSQSILGINQCGRNGHHYHYGLSSLSTKEKKQIERHHRGMYVKRGEEWFLNIRFGQVDAKSLQCPGYGVAEEPDWDSMDAMRTWLENRPRA